MKFFAFACLFIIAGATALPQYDYAAFAAKEERLVAGIITAVIEHAAQVIHDAGLDPVNIDYAEANYVLVPLIAEMSAFVERLEFVGLSNISINTMDYSMIFNRLRFDVSFPEISLAIGNSGVSVVLFGITDSANLRGSVSVRQIRLDGEVTVDVGVTGISVTSLSLNFSLGGIQSVFTLSILDRDISWIVNSLLNVTIPDYLDKNQGTINTALETIVWELIDRIL